MDAAKHGAGVVERVNLIGRPALGAHHPGAEIRMQDAPVLLAVLNQWLPSRVNFIITVRG